MPDPTPNPETQALKAALDAANRERATAVAQAQQATRELQTERAGRVSAQEQAIETSLTQARAEADTAQAEWVRCQQEGDFEKSGAALRKLNEATARADRFQAQKDWLAGQRQAQEEQQRQPTDPLAKFNAAEREWIAKNPRYLEDMAFQRKVNAAALYAQEHEGIVKDSPQYWEFIERRLYPDRYQQQPASDGRRENDTGGEAPAGDITVDVGEVPDATAGMREHHTMDAPAMVIQPDAPAMRLDERPQEPQARAVGRGAEGLRAVAAPPTRRIAETVSRQAQGQPLRPTAQEVEIARNLYDQIEPKAEDRSIEAAVRWYAFMYNHPSHKNTRRKRWVYGENAA